MVYAARCKSKIFTTPHIYLTWLAELDSYENCSKKSSSASSCLSIFKHFRKRSLEALISHIEMRYYQKLFVMIHYTTQKSSEITKRCIISHDFTTLLYSMEESRTFTDKLRVNIQTN